MFHGSIVAIVTPMLMNGEIDEQALRDLVEFHLAEGTDAIVVVGSTGESITLTEAEQLQVIRIVVTQAKERIPVIAGTGAASTKKAIAATHAAMEVGADACLIVTPYYNKPTQEGLYQHFKTIAAHVPIPIILYNIPGRTAVDMSADTVERLAAISNIIGIKEGSGNPERCSDILTRCGDSIDVYCGDDPLVIDLMQRGAKGVISITANIIPKMMHELCVAALEGQWDQAQALQDKLMPLHKCLTIETNPIPVKWALYKMDKIALSIRMPLLPLSEVHQQKVLSELQRLEIISN